MDRVELFGWWRPSAMKRSSALHWSCQLFHEKSWRGIKMRFSPSFSIRTDFTSRNSSSRGIRTAWLAPFRKSWADFIQNNSICLLHMSNKVVWFISPQWERELKSTSRKESKISSRIDARDQQDLSRNFCQNFKIRVNRCPSVVEGWILYSFCPAKWSPDADFLLPKFCLVRRSFLT